MLYPYDQITTEIVASALGRLLEIAKKSTKVSLEKSMFMMLEKRKVGTMKLEAQALDLLEESKGGVLKGRKKIKGKKIQFIVENRDPEKVVDILKLKVKYCQEEESKVQKEYRRLKVDLKEVFIDRGKLRKFRRMIRRVSKEVQIRWSKGNSRIQKKVDWLERKFRKKMDEDAAQQWVSKMAEGNGRMRERIKVDVPVYGGAKVDQDERDCLSLPIKHCMYPEVTVHDMKLQSNICHTKVRWDRRDRDFTPQGDEVTEEEPQRSMEDAIKDNEHREVYNPD